MFLALRLRQEDSVLRMVSCPGIMCKNLMALISDLVCFQGSWCIANYDKVLLNGAEVHLRVKHSICECHQIITPSRQLASVAGNRANCSRQNI